MKNNAPKVIAMYLPQFHRVIENDKWWGEGYTEWTAVKQAVSLFEGHYQPRKPLNDNYYDLMDKNVMIEQSKLMKQYNVHGFCFYHYWFKDGRMILEKPAENLIKWTDIDIPFCFSWANESWVRTWSALNNENSWACKYEKSKQDDENETGILLEQRYGGKEDWKKHFYYLLPFFKDARYIKIDEKPVFLFYKPDVISCLKDMIDYWKELARIEGLNGIYFIGTNTLKKDNFAAILRQEPQRIMKFVKSEYNNGVRCFQYDDLWEGIINDKIEDKSKIFLCGIVDYDDTPRRGNAGIAIKNVSPQQFKKNFSKLLKKSELYGNEYVFLNAWNEWGEGMYLEPDEKWGTRYLEAIKEATEKYYLEVIEIDKKNDNYKEKVLIELNEKYKSYWQILNKWLTLKENDKCLSKSLLQRKIKKIAIYGIGMLGKHLIEELKNTEVEIVYGIDRRSDGINVDFPIVSPNDDLPQVDAIIVTATYDYENIKKKLKDKIECAIFSLTELIDFE